MPSIYKFISPYSKPSKISETNYSVYFNGTDEYLNADSLVTDLKTQNVGTVLFWYKPVKSIPSTGEFLFTLGDTNGNELFYIAHLSSGKIGTLALIGGAGQFNMQTDDVLLSDNSWDLIAVRQNGTSININVNGVDVDQTIVGVPNDITAWFNDLTNADNCRFMCYNYNNLGNAGFSNGNVAEPQFYNTYLSDAELTNIFNRGIPKNESTRSSLVSYYKFGNILNNYNDEVSNEWKFYDTKGSNNIESVNMDLTNLEDDFPQNFTIYMAGQSNALGWEDMANLQVGYQGAKVGVNMFDVLPYNTIDSTSNNNQYPVSVRNTKFGCEFSLGYRLNSYLSKDINILKYAIGATPLGVDGGGLDWNTTTNELYLTLKNNIDIKNNVRGVKSIVWIQGEQDATNLTWANNYETNLTNFINGIRTHLGYDVHFTIVLLSNNMSTLTYLTTVRNAQLAVASSLPNIDTINTDSFGLQVDNVHYNASGYDDLGGAIFEIIKNK